MFDHRDPGTPETSWTADRRLAGAGALPAPVAGDHIVVLAAHPDDETLGAGGLIAAAARQGARVEIIVATDGEASHPQSPTHSPRELAARRRAEVLAAIASLHPAVTTLPLGLPDGLLARRRPALEAAIDRALAPGSLLVTPWQGDHHPDHEACAQAAKAVLQRRPDCDHWQYPIWAWHWADPDNSDWPWETVRRMELDPDAVAAKEVAIACHRSQHQPLSDLAGDETLLNDWFLAHFQRPFETFLLDPERGTPTGGRR